MSVKPPLPPPPVSKEAKASHDLSPDLVEMLNDRFSKPTETISHDEMKRRHL